MNEKKILIGIAAGTLVIAAAVGYGIYYTFGALDEQETQAQTTREDIKKARETVGKIKGVEDEVIVLRESVLALASVLPTQREIEDFITQIAATKGESGVTLREVTEKGSNVKPGQGKVFEKFGYQIGIKGNIWQSLEFLYRLESFKRFVMIPKLKITPGQRDKSGAEVVHGFELEVETFAYNPGRAGSVEPIASYDKRRDGLREEIEQAKFIIEQPVVEFGGQRGRRDVFVDPRMPTDGPTPEGALPVEQQTELVTKLRVRVEELAALVSRSGEATNSFIERFEYAKQLEEKVPGLRADIDKTQKDGVVNYPLVVRVFQIQVKDAFEKIVKKLGERPVDVGPSKSDLAAIVDRVRGLLQSGRLRESIEGAKPVLDKWASLDKDPERKGFIEELKKLDRDAKIAERFEQKKLVIGGVILYEDRKAALVNGKTVEPGDSIDEDLTISDIHEDSVTFVLDNVQITKKW